SCATIHAAHATVETTRPAWAVGEGPPGRTMARRESTRPAPKGRLVLQDGAVFPGVPFGATVPASGEVVFTTGMVGYPEALTDPSYRGQILTFTFPSVGNYGVPGVPRGAPGELPPRPWESSRIHASGVVCASYSEDFSHHSADRSLEAWLCEMGVPGLTGVDTRALTKRIRLRGALLGRFEIDGQLAPDFDDPNRRNLVAEVSTK